MSRQLPGTHYQTTSCDMVICSGLVNVLVVSDRLKPMWHGTVDMPCIDFVAITAAYNWEPYLALMPVTATEGGLAAGDTSVGSGPRCEYKPLKQTTAKSRRYIIDLVPTRNGVKKTIKQYTGT